MPKKTHFWAKTFRSDVHEVNDNGKVPFVALSLPILRSVTKSQCQSAILTKRKVTMRKQKLNGKLLFATLFILHRCKKRKEKTSKETKTKWQKLLCCAQPPSLQKRDKKRKQRAYWQTSCCDFVQPPSLQKRKQKKAKKTSEATKSRMANYLLWPCPASISAWQQLAPVSDQGSMPIMPMGKLKTIRKFCYFKQEVGNMAGHFFPIRYLGAGGKLKYLRKIWITSDCWFNAGCWSNLICTSAELEALQHFPLLHNCAENPSNIAIQLANFLHAVKFPPLKTW